MCELLEDSEEDEAATSAPAPTASRKRGRGHPPGAPLGPVGVTAAAPPVAVLAVEPSTGDVQLGMCRCGFEGF